MLPGCGVPEAVQVLERVMGENAERLSTGDHPNFTVSFGVASSDQAPDFHGVVTLADEALLQAKSGGRNQIVVANALGSAHPSNSERPVSVASNEPTTPSLIKTG